MRIWWLASMRPPSSAPHVEPAARRLPSWDEFLIPLAFARCAAVFGEAVGVPRDVDRTWMRREMERFLTAVTTTADRMVRP
jgi:lysophospholipid acyltransferase (LPLAT)-like uncharacterized protein